MRLERTGMTFLKYILWTAVAAAITAAIDNLAGLNIPPLYVPLIAAVLKSVATFWATQEPK